MSCNENAPNDFCPRCSHDVPSEGTYERGSKIPFKWVKNNHDASGFVKFSIVPYEDKCVGAKHKMMSFYYTCWGRGLYRCNGDECGTDGNNEAFSAEVEIPTVLPDGEYMVGWVWYGGGVLRKYTGNMGHWSDYYSCSHITVKGGVLTGKYSPRFNPGDGAEYQDGCMSATDRVGPCRVGEDCRDTKMEKMVPKEFKDGNVPEDLTVEMFGGDGSMVTADDAEKPDPVEEPKEEASPAESSSSSSEEASPAESPAKASPADSSAGDGEAKSGDAAMGEITGMFLVNGESDTKLDDDLLDPNTSNEFTLDTSLPEVNLVADVEGDGVTAVKFYVNGDEFSMEKSAPYALASNGGSDYRSWKEVLDGGEFQVKAVVMGEDDTELDSKTVKLVFKKAE